MERLHALVRLATSKNIFEGAVKVRSHEDPDHYPLVERWAIEGNDFADALAQTAPKNLPSQLLDTWQRMKLSRQAIAQARDDVHWLFIDVGHRSLKSEHLME